MPLSLAELNFNRSPDRVLKQVRALAKTSYWQTVYSSSKELGFQLFDNKNKFSDLQLLFLNYLGFYATINMDIALGDVTDIVLEDELYEDAYITYKQKVDKKKMTERSNPQAPRHQETQTPQTNWVFRKPKKA